MSGVLDRDFRGRPRLNRRFFGAAEEMTSSLDSSSDSPISLPILSKKLVKRVFFALVERLLLARDSSSEDSNSSLEEGAVGSEADKML
jgi:hypothetical protein